MTKLSRAKDARAARRRSLLCAACGGLTLGRLSLQQRERMEAGRGPICCSCRSKITVFDRDSRLGVIPPNLIRDYGPQVMPPPLKRTLSRTRSRDGRGRFVRLAA